MSKILITRDEETCVRCGECIDVCPHSGDDSFVQDHVITQEEGEVPTISNPVNCIGCYSCKDTCRSEAIHIEGIEEITSILSDEEALNAIQRII